MRILVHDYAGHPFQVQLSRELAMRGHEVFHFYAGYNVTPRGALARKGDDPPQFHIGGIFIRENLQKYSFIKRWRQEREYGRLLVDKIEDINPDVMITANTPLDPQSMAIDVCKRTGIKYVYWLQDLVGLAMKRILSKRIPLIGNIIGSYYLQLGKRLLRASDKIVLITEDHIQYMRDWGIDDDKLKIIPNWAPLEDIPSVPKQNPWSQARNLEDKFCFMYSGTLGLKHNPELLLQLAIQYADQPHVVVVVISEGPGSEWLEKRISERGLENLILLPYQPFEELPLALATADVLLAILEPDAGEFSVPSKVLTYLCVGRPTLLAVPSKNLAARIVSENRAGLVVKPGDTQAFLANAANLFQNSDLRDELAGNALAYARKTFNIADITDQFEDVIS